MSHTFCGLRVESDLPIPELLPWTGGERAPDIEIRLGDVPDRLEAPVFDGPLLQIAPDGTCRFAVAGIAAFLVEGGRRITVRPWMDPAASDIRVFLLGSVFGFLCHQRGLLPLHAGCVEIGGRAVAFAGDSGAGKSTLTAAFLRRGHPVLTDDLMVVEVDAPGGPRVLPAYPRIKLWRDTMDGLGLPADGLKRTRAALEKFFLPVEPARFHAEPLPLAAIYSLRTAQDARHAGIEPLRGSRLVDSLVEAVFVRHAALRIARREPLLATILRLTAVPGFRLSRVLDLAAVDATAAAVEARHGAGE